MTLSHQPLHIGQYKKLFVNFLSVSPWLWPVRPCAGSGDASFKKQRIEIHFFFSFDAGNISHWEQV